MTTKQAEDYLLARGFDRSEGRRVACSQCAALAINGVACHETGCPNATHECRGCNAIIPARQKYCDSCWGLENGECLDVGEEW